MLTQIFLASTLYGAATLAAGVDAGSFPPAGRRILLTSNHAVTAEVTPGWPACRASPRCAPASTRCSTGTP